MIFFCEHFMSDYKQFFGENMESNEIVHCKHRFVWFTKKFELFKSEYSKCFPKNWNIDQILSERFCFMIVNSFIEILEKKQDTLNSEIILKSLNETITFGKFLHSYIH